MRSLSPTALDSSHTETGKRTATAHVQQSQHTQGGEGKQHDTLPFRELQGGMWLLVLICTQLFQLNRGIKNVSAVDPALCNLKPFEEPHTPFCCALEQNHGHILATEHTTA